MNDIETDESKYDQDDSIATKMIAMGKSNPFENKYELNLL